MYGGILEGVVEWVLFNSIQEFMHAELLNRPRKSS